MGLEIKELSVELSGQQILKQLNLSVESGELIAILGASGNGKTSLLKALCGLIEPTEGQIILDGQNLAGQATDQRAISIVFQDLRLFPHMSVENNLKFPLEMSEIPKQEWQSRIDQLLKDVHLEGYNHRRIQSLSGGQQQRVAIARALAKQPRLLLLDEPFSSLDEGLRIEMRELVKRIQDKHKITTLIVTHDKNEAMQLASRIALLHDQTVHQCAAPTTLLNQPKDRLVADYFGPMNYVSGQVKQQVFTSDLFTHELTQQVLEDGNYTAVVRPSYLEVQPLTSTPEPNQMVWTIDHYIEQVEYIQVHCHCRTHQWSVTMTPKEWHELSLTEGQEVLLRPMDDRVWFISEG